MFDVLRSLHTYRNVHGFHGFLFLFLRFVFFVTRALEMRKQREREAKGNIRVILSNFMYV